MYNVKHTILLCLFTVSVASPATHLEDRGEVPIPNPLVCDGETWTKQQITRSISQAALYYDQGYYYPKTFFNQAGGHQVFPSTSPLDEFPLTDPVWTSRWF